MPYSIGISAVAEAIRAAGREDEVTVVTKDGDDVGLKAVANGSSAFNAAPSLRRASWAGIDQAIPGLNGLPYLTDAEVGNGVHLYTADDIPADFVSDLTGWVDFPAEYEKVWGISQ